ncbi:MAG: PadR family transcriptional regulator [Acidimicrobiales bacterium]
MIELATLGLLKEQELHGYELRKRLGELPGARSAVVSFGSLYPALARLERGGLVKAVEANTLPAAVPSSGSLTGELAAFRSRRAATTRTGRSKKVYGITARGEAALVELLTDPVPTDERTFALKVAFCRHLGAEARLELFERRRGELAQRAAASARKREPERLLDRYTRSLRERDDETLTNDLAWLDRLIAGEQAATPEEPTQ